jgi:hypothetical protein
MCDSILIPTLASGRRQWWATSSWWCGGLWRGYSVQDGVGAIHPRGSCHGESWHRAGGRRWARHGRSGRGERRKAHLCVAQPGRAWARIKDTCNAVDGLSSSWWSQHMHLVLCWWSQHMHLVLWSKPNVKIGLLNAGGKWINRKLDPLSPTAVICREGRQERERESSVPPEEDGD